MNLEHFIARLLKARYVEAYVAARISECGCDVVFPGLKVASSEKEALNGTWKRTPDLLVRAPSGDMRLEVKGTDREFRTARERDSVTRRLVCSEGSYSPERDYVFVSVPTGGCVWLPAGSRVQVVSVYDSDRKESYRAVAHEPGDAQDWEALVERLKGAT